MPRALRCQAELTQRAQEAEAFILVKSGKWHSERTSCMISAGGLPSLNKQGNVGNEILMIGKLEINTFALCLLRGTLHQHISVQLPDPGERGKSRVIR